MEPLAFGLEVRDSVEVLIPKIRVGLGGLSNEVCVFACDILPGFGEELG